MASLFSRGNGAGRTGFGVAAAVALALCSRATTASRLSHTYGFAGQIADNPYSNLINVDMDKNGASWAGSSIGSAGASIMQAVTHARRMTQVDNWQNLMPGDNFTIDECKERWLEQQYLKAIEDAAVAEAPEVLPLLSLPCDPEAYVDVVTWVNAAFTNSYPVGQTVNHTFDSVFVTVAGEVQNKCRNFVCQLGHQRCDWHNPTVPLALRIEQLLGLPPSTTQRLFVTLRVQVKYIFRPCGSPNVCTTTCPLTLQPGQSPDFYTFYARQSAGSYVFPGGFPWTRLGYTFDWGSASQCMSDQPQQEYGASEYVVKQYSLLEVIDKQTTEDYCSDAPVVNIEAVDPPVPEDPPVTPPTDSSGSYPS